MVVKAILSSIVALTFLSSCASETYDDCLLSGMEGKNSDRAVTAVEDVCRRKFEQAASRKLEIQPQETEMTLEALESAPKYLVTNSGPNIVTQIVVLTPKGEWTINTWIEPDRWEAFDAPTPETESFMKNLRAGKITSSAVKEIPTQ